MAISKKELIRLIEGKVSTKKIKHVFRSRSRYPLKELSQLPQVKIIFKITQNLDNTNVSMFQIIKSLIQERNIDAIKDYFLGNRPSTAPSTIKKRRDVCFGCKNETSCSIMLNSLRTIREKVDVLLSYRYQKGTEFIKPLKSSSSIEDFNMLLDDPLYVKFLVNYGLVVDLKRELIAEKILCKNVMVLWKYDGLYCPFKDIWKFNIEEIV